MQPTLRRYGVLVFAFFGFCVALADPGDFLQVQQDVPLGSNTSRFDYQALDPQSGILYIAHKGAGQIILFNTHQNAVQNTLSGFPGVTGVLVVPELHRLFASVTDRHEVAVVDTESLKTVAHIPAGHFPDGMAYVPETRQLYISDEMGGEEIVVDVLKNKRVDYLKLEGEVGNTCYDPGSRRVFVNVQGKNEVVVIDPETRKILLRYNLQGGKHPHGLCLDPGSRLAFIGCDGDKKLVVMDMDNFREIGVSEVGKDPDVLAFDPQLGYLYVASESGVVSVFRVRDHKMEKIGDFQAGPNAHSVIVDPQTHLVYFPLCKLNSCAVLRIMKPAR